ncbi:MAG: LuxR C-terminal-related transcriptional regulator, partial [Acidobacteriota bacterium]
LDTLTPREREVMLRVVQGHLNKQIASDLNLSPKTVEQHRSKVMDKMGAESLAALVRMAVEASLV